MRYLIKISNFYVYFDKNLKHFSRIFLSPIKLVFFIIFVAASGLRQMASEGFWIFFQNASPSV